MRLEDQASDVETAQLTGHEQAELEWYKTMEIELYADMIKNEPMFNEDPVDLPYCGLGTDEYYAGGTPSSTSRLAKRGWGGVFSGIKLPTLDKPPKRPVFPPKCVPKTLEIGVYFNVITTNLSTQKLVSDSALTTAMDELNAAFKPMRISFQQKGVIRDAAYSDDTLRKFTQNRDSTSAGDGGISIDVLNRARYRQGTGKESLHVFIVEEIFNDDPTLITNGYCYFPDASVDGCLITIDTLTSVSFKDCDTDGGTVLTHEVGHWLGLKHTHEEQSVKKACSTNWDYPNVSAPPCLAGHVADNA